MSKRLDDYWVFDITRFILDYPLNKQRLNEKRAELQKPEHDSCVGCKFEHFESDQEPCKDCQYAYIDQYEPKEEIK